MISARSRRDLGAISAQSRRNLGAIYHEYDIWPYLSCIRYVFLTYLPRVREYDVLERIRSYLRVSAAVTEIRCIPFVSVRICVYLCVSAAKV